MSVRTVLIVDGDEALRRSLAEQILLQDDFAVRECASGAEAQEAAASGPCDLVLVDRHLPDMDGRELCRAMRRQGHTMPVIMLGEDDTGDALEAGASDHVAKPFRLGLLLARMHTWLHEHDERGNAGLRIGPYTFLPVSRVLVRDGTGARVRLTDKETSILDFLHRAGNRAVSRTVLLERVWGYNADITTHTLETHIYRLRQKIEADPSNARLLITEEGGYRLDP